MFFFSSDSLDNDSMVMKDKKWRKDVDDDHGKEWKGFRGSRWGFGARGQSSGLFFPSLESLDELLAQHILSGKNTTPISTYFISIRLFKLRNPQHSIAF